MITLKDNRNSFIVFKDIANPFTDTFVTCRFYHKLLDKTIEVGATVTDCNSFYSIQLYQAVSLKGFMSMSIYIFNKFEDTLLYTEEINNI